MLTDVAHTLAGVVMVAPDTLRLRVFTGTRIFLGQNRVRFESDEHPLGFRHVVRGVTVNRNPLHPCLLYTSDAAADSLRVDLGGRRIIKKKKKHLNSPN